jgi:hypothetical protein
MLPIGNRNLEFRLDAAAEHPNPRMVHRNLKGPFQIIGIQDVVVIDEDTEGSGCFAETTPSRER